MQNGMCPLRLGLRGQIGSLASDMLLSHHEHVGFTTGIVTTEASATLHSLRVSTDRVSPSRDPLRLRPTDTHANNLLAPPLATAGNVTVA